MAFRGTFDYSLDAKNRLTLPAKFRGALGEKVVLAKGTANCVTVWTPDEFDAYVAAALEGEHPLSKRADQINRFFQSNSHEVDIDAAGRVPLTGRGLMEHAGLTKEVVVTGVGTRLEIWDRKAWDDYNGALDIDELTASFNNVA